MSSKISIVMATYNGEKYLEEQLNSIVQQTIHPYEVVISDDNSTDTTLEVVEKFKSKLNIRLYQNKHNLGFLKNFEKAIHYAEGDFIALCDQDDIWCNNKLDVLINNIDDKSLVYSDSLLIDSLGNSLNRTLSEKLRNKFHSSQSALEFLYDNSISAHSMMFRKELIKYLGSFPENIYFDAYIAATAASLNGIKFVDQNLVKYRQHETNTLSNNLKNKKSLKTKVLTKVEKKYHNNLAMLNKINDFLKVQTLHTDEKDLLNKLHFYYDSFKERWFSIGMFLFLLKNSHIFFNITKKNTFLVSLKKSIGFKLYKVAPFL